MARRTPVKNQGQIPPNKVFWTDPTKKRDRGAYPYFPQFPMMDPNAVDLEHYGVHMLMGEVNEETCAYAMDWILRENFSPNRKPHLTLMICSPGGNLATCFGLIDVMLGSQIPVHTVGVGQIASCGLLLFITGARGNRTLTPNTSILSHQYSWGSYGKEHELVAQVKEFNLTGKRMLEHYKHCTGLSEANIRKYLLPPEDMYLSAEEAKRLRMCDKVQDVRIGKASQQMKG
jgi:ATP-dependent Clp protease protease subunit